MLSDNDLTFHIPSAGLRRMDAWTATNPSAFSHLHLVGNPDWMSSFSASSQVAAARPALAPPAPVAIEPSTPRLLAAPAAIDAPAPAAKKSFLSMFYRGSSNTVSSTAMPPKASSAASTLMSAPPKALDAFDTPMQRALPVDAQLSVEHLSKLDAVDATISAAPRREPPRPMALGSDTWNALSSVPLPAKTTAGSARLLAPPASIDAVFSRDSKPLWSDLSFTSCFRSTAPTLEAFRSAPPAPILSTPPRSPQHQATSSTATVATVFIPVPPKPVTASPLRDAAVSSAEAAAPAAIPAARRELRAMAHPLVPVGEDAPAVVTPLLKPVEETPMVSSKSANLAPSTVNATPPVWGPEPLSLAGSEPERSASPLPTEFAKSISRPTMQQAQRDEARAAANVRNFISTLFSGGGSDETDSPTAGNRKADGFNALEFVTNRRGAQAKASQPVDYSTFFNTSLFEDDHDEDSEEGLEKLRRVVLMVMQSAKNSEGNSVPQPTGQSCRRGGGVDGTGVAPLTTFPSKYTEFSASYQTANNNNADDNEWMQFAR
ncbi:conserved hypothetical protein [Leishmania infantum JPCM5]|uniref:Uncharacterized protein n=2 Tax=Leishmania infantum TaxID=5671 RepID=A4IDE1_LEIIN|nr:conserved hypothetical protein [Leishmania infantum JPCM5]CAC9549847.1 hypothetical_protein_-_conserved [Leishmania infantum]CAM72872.1 conserved hypothetical protein [Leishmania infantum JPCM5]SUZ46550.1 hypothetical_protein_-_conserved [Leishmania infantum]|eukprot:XP_001469760.1 conserved hypothetical protein [Leishmania infantum JPCM5]